MTRSLAIGIAVQVVLTAMIGIVVLDMRAHNRVEELGGVNVWGYRGTELGEKHPHHIRIAVFGGDLAFGWGVKPSETLASYTGRLVSLELNQAGRQSRPVTAVVAAAQGMRVAEYAGWIERFRDLQPDIICLVPDEPGHQLQRGRFLPDRRSRVFARTGYSPILPLVLREKADVMHSAILGAAARVAAAADVEVARAPERDMPAEDALASAIEAARRVAAIGVVVVLPPRWDDERLSDPTEEPGVRIVRLAADRRMTGADLRLDGYSFSAGGHSLAADSVAPAVLDLIHVSDRKPR